MGLHKENRKETEIRRRIYVTPKGAEEFQCKDCKYYMYSGSCLLIRDNFTPEMSCAFVVKNGKEIEI